MQSTTTLAALTVDEAMARLLFCMAANTTGRPAAPSSYFGLLRRWTFWAWDPRTLRDKSEYPHVLLIHPALIDNTVSVPPRYYNPRKTQAEI